MKRTILATVMAVAALAVAQAQAEPRARDLGVPFEGTPGPLNAITDVKGVTVGHTTLIGDVPGDAQRKIRTGVTAILPRGRDSLDTYVFGAWSPLNGNGEMTGTAWLAESGQLEGPVLLTNTHSVGVVRDAAIQWRFKAGDEDEDGYWWSLPVVAETWDGELNDINGFHVRPEHVASALAGAKGGPVAEGNVGAGTGTECHDFKCGIGTASRVVTIGKRYVVGVLVQANYGNCKDLRIAGAPVGKHMCGGARAARVGDNGSIIIVVATDAPLLPQQLRRLAARAGMGLARMGSHAGNESGDIFIAFSTANKNVFVRHSTAPAAFLRNREMDLLFAATVQATEEAIVNSMIAARDMKGTEGSHAEAISHTELIRWLKHYNRYEPPR
jgi:D-aminopeptidase